MNNKYNNNYPSFDYNDLNNNNNNNNNNSNSFESNSNNNNEHNSANSNSRSNRSQISNNVVNHNQGENGEFNNNQSNNVYNIFNDNFASSRGDLSGIRNNTIVNNSIENNHSTKPINFEHYRNESSLQLSPINNKTINSPALLQFTINMEDVKGLNEQLDNGELSIVSYQYFKGELKFQLYAHDLDSTMWVDGSKLKNQKLLISQYNDTINYFKKKLKELKGKESTILTKLQKLQLSNLRERSLMFRNTPKRTHKSKVFKNNCFIPANPSNDEFEYLPITKVILKNASDTGKVNYLLEDITEDSFWIPMASTNYILSIISEKEIELSKDELVVYGFEIPTALNQSDIANTPTYPSHQLLPLNSTHRVLINAHSEHGTRSIYEF